MTLLDWQKKITRRVFVDENVSLGELNTLLVEMWEDALRQRQNIRDVTLNPLLKIQRGSLV